MKNKFLILNVFYAFLLQFSTLIFPLITMPYISKIIGPSGLGRVDFATSVVNWFLLFSTFGLLSYGVREVSKIRDDEKKLSVFFSEILIIKVILTFAVLLVYIPSILLIDRLNENLPLFVLYIVLIITNIFSLDWFFQGLENYKFITFRSIILKILAVISIFLFVKTHNDFMVYAAINILTLSLGNLWNFFHSKRYVKISLKGINITNHLKSMSTFFITTLIISIYTLLDTVILGFIKGDEDVAFYTRAKMFFGIGMALSVAINNALTPRLNNYFQGDKNQYSSLLKTSFNLLLLISMPIMVGVGILSENLMVLFGGEKFHPASLSLMIIAPLLVITPMSIWNYQQRILPYGKEKAGLYINSVVAVVSLIFNISLVPVMGYIGTSISWLISEVTGLIISFVYMKRKESIKIFDSIHLKYFVSSLLMGMLIWGVNSFFSLTWFNTVICIVLGGLMYFCFLLLFREENILLVLKMGMTLLKRSKSSKKGEGN
ncbi:hypothetical protein A8F94_10860 [Bacillus sp. FJAT-27225]|uniref:flippase n=1 Tax=Bacillus sp. FJAT-27225 TaxID=1743144 RepID=UPI00080C2355|nr:flippase [Bacillus sp. FJAT-27225]OCA88290.1 hypothetical protein A8F94_10860 [Bacillus sp. FJAT-27225]